ncbi:MAG: hypothetical protein R3252_03580 [Robiginitalea sp.]|nr:hypothetical protein [Robiginitalea sp.]
MKPTTLLICLLLASQAFAQADAVAGDYFVQLGSEDSRLIEYRLTLHQDGTFNFHAHAKSSENIGIPETSNDYGRGTWLFKDKKVLFDTNPEKDLEGKYSLNFTNSRAHFLTKSSRDLSGRPFKIRLKFYESDIFWIKGLEIFKR